SMRICRARFAFSFSCQARLLLLRSPHFPIIPEPSPALPFQGREKIGAPLFPPLEREGLRPEIATAISLVEREGSCWRQTRLLLLREGFPPAARDKDGRGRAGREPSDLI